MREVATTRRNVPSHASEANAGYRAQREERHIASLPKVRDASPVEDVSHADAVPGIDRRSRRSSVLFIVEVDGERFAVRRSVDGGTDYERLTGPDHGWATSDSPDRPREAHVEHLRASLRLMTEPR